MAKKQIQIDAIKNGDIPQIPNWMRCVLYADGRAINIYMHIGCYEILVHDGFFIRDGKELDSANVLNTTSVYELKGGKDEN